MTAPAHEKLREDARFNAAMFDNREDRELEAYEMRIIAACNTIDDLATCCKQLIYALKRTDSKSDAGDRAMNFLQRHNLIGSPLRDQQESRHAE